MLTKVDHIAIICSKEDGVDFYKAFGFEIVRRQPRPDRGDEIVWMQGNGIVLEVFIDSGHPLHVTKPEAYGLRHLALETDDIEKECARIATYGYTAEPIRRTPDGGYMTFIKDPDGLPIELTQKK